MKPGRRPIVMVNRSRALIAVLPCFVLVAPPGSQVTSEGVDLQGIGSFAMGHRLRSVGFLQVGDVDVRGIEGCLGKETGPHQVAVVGGG